MCVQKKIVIERTRDLIYLKFVAIDFFPKIISPSAGENSGDLASAVSALLPSSSAGNYLVLHYCSALLQNLVRKSEETQCLEEISRGKCRCSLSSSSNC